MKVWDNDVAASNGAALRFDAADGSRTATAIPFGKGCFAPRQTRSFTGRLDLAWAPGSWLLHGSCEAGPMAGAAAFALVGTGLAPQPLVLNPLGCALYLEPASLLALGPWTLDHLGGAAVGVQTPMASLPADPAWAGLRIFGQWVAVANDWLDRNIYAANPGLVQLPPHFAPAQGPAVTTISAQGVDPGTVATGTVQRNFGLIVEIGG